MATPAAEAAKVAVEVKPAEVKPPPPPPVEPPKVAVEVRAPPPIEAERPIPAVTQAVQTAKASIITSTFTGPGGRIVGLGLAFLVTAIVFGLALNAFGLLLSSAGGIAGSMSKESRNGLAFLLALVVAAVFGFVAWRYFAPRLHRGG